MLQRLAYVRNVATLRARKTRKRAGFARSAAANRSPRPMWTQRNASSAAPARKSAMRSGCATNGSRRSGRSAFLDALDVQVDGDLVADEDAAAFESLVPGESEVLAVDRRRAVESRPLLAVGALPLAEEARVEDNRARHAVKREVSAHFPFFAARIDVARPRALEGDLRKLFGVEEVRGAQMAVALLDVGVDAGGIDRSLHLGLGGALFVIDDLALEHLEAPGHGGEEMAHVELDRGMCGIDGEGVGERRSAEAERRERRPHEDASVHDSS